MRLSESHENLLHREQKLSLMDLCTFLLIDFNAKGLQLFLCGVESRDLVKFFGVHELDVGHSGLPEGDRASLVKDNSVDEAGGDVFARRLSHVVLFPASRST